jgi:prepilin-type N-terminal cleavage/methylation domain-containing protein
LQLLKWSIISHLKTLLSPPAEPPRTLRPLARNSGFTLIEAAIAVAIVAIGFLGAFATVLQAGKMVSASEEEALIMSGLEQRIDQLRLLQWPELTDGTGITSAVWTARPESTTGITVSQETFTISPCDVPGAQTLNATWNGVSIPTVNFTAGTALGGASAVKVVATLTWTGRRSGRTQTRGIITVISRGGISKSDRP